MMTSAIQPSSVPASDHIAPAPRVAVQAFCETVEIAGTVKAAVARGSVELTRRIARVSRPEPRLPRFGHGRGCCFFGGKRSHALASR